MRALASLLLTCMALASATACSDDSMSSPSASVESGDDGATTGDGLTAGDGAIDVILGTDTAVAADASVPEDVAVGTDGAALADVPVQLDVASPQDVAIAPDVAVGADAISGSDGGVPAPFCGNGYCDPGEDPKTCGQDCKGFSWTCGDGICDIGEQFYCQNDCTKPFCGDGKCEPGEQAQGCSKDCPNTVVCGDTICGVGENGQNCPKDCGIGTWTCGDNKCDIGEQFYCPQDCQSTVPDPMSCLQAKCATDYGKCAPDPACASALQCLVGCKGDWACLQGCVQAAGGNGSSAVQVAFCGQQNGCL